MRNLKGKLYGIGVGPGDPELITLKGARLIRECAVIAVPHSGAPDQVALDIAASLVGDKPVLNCPMPMVRDEQELAQAHKAAADLLCEQLDAGRDVAFLTIGDPSVYSTYIYLHRLVEVRGYQVEMVPGVPSFCAAAAALNMPLCEAGQPLHIVPASYDGVAQALALDGVKVLMKSGKKLAALLSELKSRGQLQDAVLAERVGLADQRLVRDLATVKDMPGYLSLVILKNGELRKSQ